jgi:hypothetical protein
MTTIRLVDPSRATTSSFATEAKDDPSLPLTSIFTKSHWSEPTRPLPVDIKLKREKLAQNGYNALRATMGTDEVKKEIKKMEGWFPYAQSEGSDDIWEYENSLPQAIVLGGVEKSYKYSYVKLANRIINVLCLIETPPHEGKYYQHMQLIREKIDKIVSMPVYQELAKGEKIAMIDFLQEAGYVLNTQTEGMSVIEEIGKEAVEGTIANGLIAGETFSAKDLSAVLKQAIENTPGYRKDTLGQLLLWVVAHLKKAVYGFMDEFLTCGHRSYKPYKLDNTFIHIGDYIIGEKRVRFNLGPSVASDQVFEKAHLLFLRKHNKAHYQHSLEQGKNKKGEMARSAIQNKIAQDNNEFFYWRSPLDGDIWKGKRDFSNIQSVEDYHKKLGKEIEKSRTAETGFDLDSVFTQEDINEALQCSTQAFKALVPGQISLDPDENRRLSKAMLLGFTGFLAIRAMQNFGKKLKTMSEKQQEHVSQSIGEAIKQVLPSMGEACKQDVDRGIIINAVTRAFIELIDKGSFNEASVHQIVGMIKFRGLEVDDRVVLEDRLEAFLDLFNLIGGEKKQENFVNALAEFAGQKEQMQIKFEPSHHLSTKLSTK